MNLAQMGQYVKSVEKDLTRIEEEVNRLSHSIIPDLQNKVSELAGKILFSNILWSMNVILLAFILYKVYDLKK
jgi:hypothetical protein